MLRIAPLLLLLVGLLSSPALGMSIHALGDQDPGASGFRTGGNRADWTRGWRFTVNTAGLSVSELGMQAASAGDFVITLFEEASGTAIASTSVTHSAGGWQWTSLASSVALNQGANYIVALHSLNNARYFWGRRSDIGNSWFPTGGDIDYLDMRYCNNCAPGTLPTRVLNDYQYGVVDIGYTVPEATTTILMVLGLVGLAWQGTPSRMERA